MNIRWVAVVGLALCLNLKSFAEDRFVVIADAQVPDLMKTVQSVGAFSEKIQPGMQNIIAAGVVALNFDPKFAPFDMNSKLQVSLYGDSLEKASLPILCGVAKYRNKKYLPKKIKLNKKQHLFVKPIEKQALICSSEKLLKDINEVPQTSRTESDLVINMFPDRYIKKCPGNIAHLRGLLGQEMEKSNKETEVLDNKSLERLLQQCEKMEVKVNAEESHVKMQIQIKPVAGMELASFLKASKPGEISTKDVINLGKKISGNKTFNVKDGLNGIISRLLGKFFNDGDSEPFDQLCDIKASHDKSTLFLQASISQTALHKALIVAGVVKPQQKKTQ